VIVPKLAEAGVQWRGWHSFRRGLGANLYRLGAPDKDIQPILRHANVNTTLAYHVKTASKNSQATMQKLDKSFKSGLTSGMRRKCRKS
jgi:integrase